MAPARGAKDILPFFFPANIPAGNVFSDCRPFMEDEIEGAGLFHRFGQAVFPGLVFFGAQFGLKSAEELVPDDEEHPHVLIEVFRVGGMMDPVVGRGDQDVFEPTHFVDQFGVHEDPPDLGCRVHEYDIQRFEAE